MRKIILFLIFLTSLGSCGLESVGVSPHSNPDGIWKSPLLDRYNPETCYATGYDYPSGYDWKSYSGDGLAVISLVMFADGVPVLRIPVGEKTFVSDDPYGHRIIKGHLYTDWSGSGMTVVKKDGKEMFRYEGEESVADMDLHEGRVHQLSLHSGGQGFSYRVDGEEVLAREEGHLLGQFRQDDGDLCFFFSQPMLTSDGRKDAYYMVRNGKVGRLETGTESLVVRDITISDGDTVLMVSSAGDEVPILIWNGQRISMESKFTGEMISCSFLDSEELCARLRLRNTTVSDMIIDVLWAGQTDWKIFGIMGLVSAVYVDGNGYSVAVNPSSGGQGSIFRNGQKFRMPEGYSVYMERCMTCRDSSLFVALSSGTGRKPVIWKNGSLDTLDINGPLTCLQ